MSSFLYALVAAANITSMMEPKPGRYAHSLQHIKQILIVLCSWITPTVSKSWANIFNLLSEYTIPSPGSGNRESQIRWTQKDPHQDIIKIPKIKERFLKATREKQSHIEGNSNKTISWFFCKNFVGQKWETWYKIQ